jgi:hypothetical protein
MTGFDSKRRIALDRLELPEQEPVVFYRCNGCDYAREGGPPTICGCMEGTGFERVEYFTAPPLPVQEPVAWVIYYKGGGSKSLHWPEQHSPNGDANMFDAVPLVPQRPWVELTNEEIEAIEEKALTKQWAIRMALTAVKEKNT